MAIKFLDNNGVLYLWQKIKTALGLKQDTLVSGTNIKTVGGQSILGTGDIPLASGGTTDYTQLTNLPTINGVTVTGAQTSSSLSLATAAQGAKADTALQSGNNVSLLANDAKYQTDTQVAAAIAAAELGSFEVVTSLPATGAPGTIYLVENPVGSGIYTQHTWVNGAYIDLGNTQLDLSGYVKTTDLVAITNAEIDTIVV